MHVCTHRLRCLASHNTSHPDPTSSTSTLAPLLIHLASSCLRRRSGRHYTHGICRRITSKPGSFASSHGTRKLKATCGCELHVVCRLLIFAPPKEHPDLQLN